MSEAQVLLITVDGERLALPVAEVRQVVADVRVQPLPDRTGAVAGFVSLRGRVATAVDVARCLGRSSGSGSCGPRAAVVVRHRGEDCALLVDRVDDLHEPTEKPLGPEAVVGLTPRWRELARSVHRLPDGLAVEIDLPALLQAAGRGTATEGAR